MKHTLLYSLIGILVIVSAGSAQYISKYEQPISAPYFFTPTPDSLLYLNEDSLIAAQIGIVDTTVLPPKSTTVAMVSSMIIPGTGQIYNESYWKAPVVWGFTYYFYSVYRNQDRLYLEQRSIYERTIASIDTASTVNIKTNLELIAKEYRSVRDFHKRQRNEFGWYLAFTYILNVVDAYVDAALFNFEVSPNLQGTSDWRMNIRVPIRK
ncbi:MAG: hypothetical protein KA247_09010 [Bacteroidetes bacterium]|nr:hypothetical protein [Bacteroidota bacterium]